LVSHRRITLSAIVPDNLHPCADFYGAVFIAQIPTSTPYLAILLFSLVFKEVTIAGMQLADTSHTNFWQNLCVGEAHG
jgi:hypothetical protein